MRQQNNQAVVFTGLAALVMVALWLSVWLGLIALAAFVIKVVVT